MALLVDGSWCTVDDLQAYDGGAITVAAEEGINLAAKMALSETWITDRVDAFLRWESSLTAQNAVIDDGLKRWHITNVLAMLYRDASFSQANDRFEKKWKALEQDAIQRKREYFLGGVSYTGNPVRRPKPPLVNVIVGSQAAAGYSAAITRVDGAGRESAPSEVTAVQAPAGNSLTVAATDLASGESWNVYTTDGNGPMRKQNDVAMDRSAVWTLPILGVTEGPELDNGQLPDGRIRQRRVLPRG